jgi:glycosyltransferase involved in cell wall biosynthesis
VAEKLAAEGTPSLICNTAPRPGASGLRYHFSRLGAYLYSCWAILSCAAAGPAIVYLSLSGGLGLLYDLAIVVAARFRGCGIIFHHHSFAYITTPSRLMRLMVNIGASSQAHVVLCPMMGQRLVAGYGCRVRYEVISNLLFLEEPDAAAISSRGALRVIGYLSMLSFEKGVDRYLDLFASLRARGSRLTGIMAGRFESRQVQEYVERRIREIGNIEYWGEVHDDRKRRFLTTIDLLVLPTRYANEADPLVVYEAQLFGAAVAASARGCLAEPARAGSLVALDSTSSDLGQLVERILSWERDPATFQCTMHSFRGAFGTLVDHRVEDAQAFRRLFGRSGGVLQAQGRR